MKSFVPLTLIAAVAILVPSTLSAQIINIDFLAQRGTESVASNYVGAGAAGGGSTFNGLTSNNSSSGDNINVSGTDLLDSNGVATTTDFSITKVGADHPASGSGGILTGNNAYLFINSALNHQLSVSFTISGLDSATEENLFFYESNTVGLDGGTITLNGGAKVTFASSGIYTSSKTVEFENVPVIDGMISGTFSTPSGAARILSGLTIEAVPEPSAWALMLGGIALLLGIQRFRKIA